MHSFRFLLLLLVFLISSVAYAKEQLVFSVDLIRHGDRTPIGTIPSAPYQWPQGNGQLTAEGMQQEFQLGSKFRKHYIEQTHLLPANYLASSIYVRSTDIDRTLMSAESLLMGLYPLGTGPNLTNTRTFLNFKKAALPRGYQPIPIHTTPVDQEKIFFLAHHTAAFQNAIAQHVLNRPDWIAKNASVASKFPHWSEATGIKITNIVQLISLGDDLFITQLHHAPLPKGLTKADISEMIDVGRWAFATSFKANEIARITGEPLLKAIQTYLFNAQQQPRELKYVLLSGHDTSILGVISAMGAPLDTPPHYASHVNFALYKNEQQQFHVCITYNDEALHLPGCNGTVCTLEQFSALTVH